LAAHEGFTEEISLLAEHGARLEIRTNFLWTPLHWAVYQQHPQSAIRLLQLGADVNAANMTGNTALHFCGFNNDPRMAAILLHFGADINRRNLSGSTPLDYAVHQNATETVAFLLKAHADPNSGKGQGVKGKDSQPPLARAAMLGFPEMVRLLLAYHANINLPDAGGNTPLHEAVRRNHPDIVIMLLADRQCRPLVKNTGGKTALDLCRNPDIRKIMLSRITELVFSSVKSTDDRNIIFATPFQRHF